MRDLWEQVQARLVDNRQGGQRAPTVRSPSLLAGRVVDDVGEPLVATHACKGKVRYRYYVSRSLQHEGSSVEGMRIPAKEIEVVVVNRLAEALGDPLSLLASLKAPLDRSTLEVARAEASVLAEQVKHRDGQVVRALVFSVKVSRERISLQLDAEGLRSALGLPGKGDCPADLVLDCPVRLTRTGTAMRLVDLGGKVALAHVDRSLINLVVQAQRWWKRLSDGQTTIAALAREEGINNSWISRVVRLNFLAPAIVEAILEGKQPAQLDGTTLTTGGELPVSWEEQARHLGLA